MAPLASPRRPPGSDGEEGRGECGLRVPRVPLPPAPLPAALGSGEGKRQVQAAPGFFPLRPPAGEPPPRPAAASSERGDPAAVPARGQAARGMGAHSLRLPSGGAPRCSCRGEGRGAGDVLLLRVSSLRQRGCVCVCVCSGEYQGSIVGSTPSPLSHQVRSVDVYYVICD